MVRSSTVEAASLLHPSVPFSLGKVGFFLAALVPQDKGTYSGALETNVVG